VNVRRAPRSGIPAGVLAVAVLAGLAAGAGCGPALLWYGHDPQRARRLELRAGEGQQWLAEVGRPGARPAAIRRSPAFDALEMSELVWSADGRRFATAGRRGSRWHVLVDFVESPPWDGVGALVFSPDGRHFAYAAERAGRWLAVLDGHAGPSYAGIVEGSLVFSPDSRRFGHAAIEPGCVRLVLDGRPGACHAGVRSIALADQPAGDVFVIADQGTPAIWQGGRVHPVPGLSAFAADPRRGRWAAVLRTDEADVVVAQGQVVEQAREVRELVFAPDGRLAYAARLPDGQVVVVVDGARQGPWPDAAGLAFSGDGARLAYAVRQGGGAAVVADGRLHRFDVVVETAIGWSGDGAHWAALVGDRRRERLSIVVDGRAHLKFDGAELFGGAAVGAADPGVLRQWVVAELERHLRGGRP
jgi:hypothetical protein